MAGQGWLDGGELTDDEKRLLDSGLSLLQMPPPDGAGTGFMGARCYQDIAPPELAKSAGRKAQGGKRGALA
jgi:hypothetical protein